MCVSKRRLSHRTMKITVTNEDAEKSGKKEHILRISDVFGLNSKTKHNKTKNPTMTGQRRKPGMR